MSASAIAIAIENPLMQGNLVMTSAYVQPLGQILKVGEGRLRESRHAPCICLRKELTSLKAANGFNPVKSRLNFLYFTYDKYVGKC